MASEPLGLIPDGTPVPVCVKCGSYKQAQGFFGYCYRWRCPTCEPYHGPQQWEMSHKRKESEVEK